MLYYGYGHHRALHSFPTRRSSDLVAEGRDEGERTLAEHGATPIRYLDALGVLGPRMIGVHCVWLDEVADGDRKSTRLNSSHVSISYAVFCLKKKKRKHSMQSSLTR